MHSAFEADLVYADAVPETYHLSGYWGGSQLPVG